MAVPELMSSIKTSAMQTETAAKRVQMMTTALTRFSPRDSSMKVRLAMQRILTTQMDPLWTQTEVNANTYRTHGMVNKAGWSLQMYLTLENLDHQTESK